MADKKEENIRNKTLKIRVTIRGATDPIFRISIASILTFSAESGYQSDETVSKLDILHS